jgi:hypothetical protein
MKTGANKKWRVCLPVVMLMTGVRASAEPQSLGSNLVGMWSDPAPTALDQFCFFACTDAGLSRLNALLDDPANDARPYSAISSEAKAYEREYNRLRLTDAALETYPLDVAEDPGFRRCEPWGLARQMFAPHQLEIRQRGNGRLELRYGEWDARRTIRLNETKRPAGEPPDRMGYSTGHWDGETLVIETSGISSNLAPWPQMPAFSARHSDQLRIVERYTRSTDGKRLTMTATLADPWGLKEPLVLKKVWRWAPESRIAPYKDCKPATEFTKGVNRP